MIVEFLLNKRKVKRLAKGLLSIMLSLIIGLSSLAIIPYVSPTAEAATQYTSGYYTYERLDSVHAKIVDVDSNISGAVTIPETLDGYTVSVIGDYAFAWLREITRVTVPSGVTSINSGAFNGCSKLNYISLPDSLMYIKDWAFQNCDALTSVTISDNVLSLGNGAFYGCDSLSKVTFGTKVSVLGDYLFEGCPKLSSFSVSSSNSYLKVSNGALINGYKLVAYPPAKSTTNYSLPSGITSVGRGAFSGCKNLKTVSVSNNVVEISYYAFEDCTNLTSVSLPQNVKTINGGAFSNCSSLKTIDISKVQHLGYRAFSNCSSLTSASISNLNHLGYSAFNGCTSLTSISIPNKITEIPSSAFSGCSLLNTVSIPNTIKIVGNSAFYNCTSLSSFSLPTGITEIGSSAFDKTAYYNNSSNWSSNGLLYKGNYLLSGDNATGAVTIKDGCVLISGGSFNSNKSITSVKVSDSVKYIGASAFSRCTELTYIELGEQVASVGNYAFSNCAKLTNVKFNDKVTQIGEYAFAWSEKIEDVALPSSVTTIAYGTFQGCTSLTNVHIPNSVNKIDGCAFRDCNNLEKVFYLGVSDEWKSVKIDSYRNEGVSDSSKIYFDATVKFHSGTTDVYFEDSWFGEDNYSYNHSLAQFCADYVMMGYSYNESSVKSYLSKMGFDNVDTNMHTGRDEVNYFIASRNVVLNGEINTLIFVGTIGSYKNQWYSNFDPNGTEREKNYAGNEEVGNVHLGFADARDFVYNKLIEYISAYGINKDKMKLLVSGHSRGAATANLLAAKLIDETYTNSSTATVNRNNIYTYTFATPNVASTQKNVFDSKYKCIFNIVNPEDFVTKVMLNDWGYYRYGKTYVLPSRTNDNNWKKYLSAMQPFFGTFSGKTYDPYTMGEVKTSNIIKSMYKNVGSPDDLYSKDFVYYWNIKDGTDYKSPFEFFRLTLLKFLVDNDKDEILRIVVSCSLFYKNILQYFAWPDGGWDESLNPTMEIGGKFKQAHQMETYCAYMNAMTESQIKQTRLYYENNVNCPVDIEVYDNATNELVGKITNNVIDENVAAKENAIVMDVEGDSKSFWLPSNGDYKVVLTGNDKGTMDYTVSNFDSDLGETERANFFDIEIENGISMEGVFVSKKTKVESYTLTHEKDGTVMPTEIIDKEQMQNFTIITSAEGNGIVVGELMATSGDYMTVSACPGDGGYFTGWYENGKLVSTDINYSFVVKGNRNLIAKFTDFAIKTPSTTTINYGDSIILHADFVGNQNSLQTNSTNVCPYCKDIFTDESEYNKHLADCDGEPNNDTLEQPEQPEQPNIPVQPEQPTVTPIKLYIEWTASNDNFSYSVSADGKTCKISPNKSGETTFTATVYDENENVIGVDTQEMTSKAGFFQKIIAFFKKIFGLTKVIPQAFKVAY